jgi:hypothetical protein
MREPHYDFWRNLHHELAARRQWRDRAAVLTYALITGSVVVAFTLLTDAASEGFDRLRRIGTIGPWLPLLWTPALSVMLL